MLILNLFISECLDQIPPWNEMKEVFSVKLQNKKLLLEIISKQNLGCPNKEYNVILKHIHQNIRAYPRSKENLHWSMIGKVLLHIVKNPSKARHWQTNLYLFMNWKKFRSSAGATSKNPKILCELGKKFEVQPEKNAQKNLHLNLWVNWERLCLNLSFTVAKKDR